MTSVKRVFFYTGEIVNGTLGMALPIEKDSL